MKNNISILQVKITSTDLIIILGVSLAITLAICLVVYIIEKNTLLKYVDVNYKGTNYKVRVECSVKTGEYELMSMAHNNLEAMFKENGVEVVSHESFNGI